jgi:hypothetical protein
VRAQLAIMASERFAAAMDGWTAGRTDGRTDDGWTDDERSTFATLLTRFVAALHRPSRS